MRSLNRYHTLMTTPFHAETTAACAAQLAWANLSVRERLRPVGEFRRLLVDRRDALVEAIRADIARTPDEVISTEVLPAADAARYLEKFAARILKPRRAGGRPLWLMGCRDVVHRRPWGVVGVIGTWNYPLFLNAVTVLPALVAGNAVLWKPSEVAPRFAVVFAELVRDAGFPPACFAVLPATREAGPLLAEADVDFVHFTGSEPVGRHLAKRLGERLIPSTLELSGCDAVIVMADANLELAARAAWYSATTNQGRTCMAARRVFVQRGAWEKFVELVSRETKAIADTGLILNPPPDHPSRRESTFTPRLAVLPFDTLDEALALTAESPFRLTAAVFTRDTAAAEELATRLGVGAVMVNDTIAPAGHPGTPFGGRGASGWGSTQGDEGLLGMTTPQVVSVRGGTFRPHIDAALDANPAVADITGGMLVMAHGRTLGTRWRGLMQMVRGMMRFGKK